ncbi:MAG: ATP-dependent zinc metalloprotease FtsH [Synergistaceae bacterium]|nr:ATP-dependent zinc metalloprotease FtsH [Synergistaceae bacterium]
MSQSTPNESDSNTPGGNTPGPRKNQWVNLLVSWFIFTFVINIAINFFSSSHRMEIEYSQFAALLDEGLVKRVRFEDEYLLIELGDGANLDAVARILTPSETANRPRSMGMMTPKKWREHLRENRVFYTGKVDDPGLNGRLLAHGVDFSRSIVVHSPIVNFLSSWVVPLVIFYLIYRFISGRLGHMGGMMNVGKSKAKMYGMEKSTRVSFADVAGQEEAKESLREMVDFLNHPDKYRDIGARQPKGALLVGPPGTGKTLLAKAVAGEAGVPFFSLSGSEFVEMFVGVGASRVRDLFEQAGKNAPCIVFIDEIDAIGKSRDNQAQMGGNDEREQTLNQLLAEMDGFDSSKSVVILAATNRPEVLDKALLRPGRFDRRIIVEKPDLSGREAILAVHAAKVKMDGGVNLKEIALMTSGAAGADLANMINEAALRAVRMGRPAIVQEDLTEAVETVIAGKEKKDRILNSEEKRLVAYHEVGHALVSALQKHSTPVQKITIVPRTMGSLGYTLQTPEDERYLMTRGELLAQISSLLGGRAAEEIAFGEKSTGASNDIERATKIARGMVTQYGMSDGFGVMGLESAQNQYLDGGNVMTCSEETGARIDEEVSKIIKACYEDAKKLLSENRDSLSRIAEYLISEESITGARFMELLRA